jgi:hypothetical protein
MRQDAQLSFLHKQADLRRANLPAFIPSQEGVVRIANSY